MECAVRGVLRVILDQTVRCVRQGTTNQGQAVSSATVFQQGVKFVKLPTV